LIGNFRLSRELEKEKREGEGLEFEASKDWLSLETFGKVER